MGHRQPKGDFLEIVRHAVEQPELSIRHRNIKGVIHIEGTIGRNNLVHAFAIFKHLFSLIEKLLCRHLRQSRRSAKSIENIGCIIILTGTQRECQKRDTQNLLSVHSVGFIHFEGAKII